MVAAHALALAMEELFAPSERLEALLGVPGNVA
jgi:hypothetical protein